jgi:hypothetical protein
MTFGEKLKILKKALREEGSTLVQSLTLNEIKNYGAWYTTVRVEDCVVVCTKGIDPLALFDFMELEVPRPPRAAL